MPYLEKYYSYIRRRVRRLSHLLYRISSYVMDVTDYVFTIRIRAEIKVEILPHRGSGGQQRRRRRVEVSLSFCGFGVGSSNMMKHMDLNIFQTWREPRNDVM